MSSKRETTLVVHLSLAMLALVAGAAFFATGFTLGVLWLAWLGG